MNFVTALMVIRLITRNQGAPDVIPFGGWWFLYAGISIFIIFFAGLTSGLLIGLLSSKPLQLEIITRVGSLWEKNQAAAILSMTQKGHQLLVSLVLCNAVAIEALPIFLDNMFSQYVTIILSVTLVLFFGEVVPQAICSRHYLVCANFGWLVRILMIFCYPVAYPIGKVLDWLLGHNEGLYSRAKLKALFSIHGQEAGKGGELTQDEIRIITGALDLTDKIAEKAMTPIESTFSLEFNSKLDWEARKTLADHGYSRVPVYYENPKNIIGFLEVERILLETEVINDVCIQSIPRVPSDMPLHDVLTEFQKGSSHMAAVVRARTGEETYEEDIDYSQLTAPLLQKQNIEDEVNQVIGIITLDDIFEVLLQEKIMDERDKINVATGSGSINMKIDCPKGSRRSKHARANSEEICRGGWIE